MDEKCFMNYAYIWEANQVNEHIELDNLNIVNLYLYLFIIKQVYTNYIKSEVKEVFDFVGFILNDKETLAVFPKYFYSEHNLSVVNQTENTKNDDIKLLFDVMIKYMNKESSNAQANSHFGFK